MNIYIYQHLCLGAVISNNGLKRYLLSLIFVNKVFKGECVKIKRKNL